MGGHISGAVPCERLHEIGDGAGPVEKIERVERKEEMQKNRVKMLEKNIEKQEKEERKKNIIIRRVYKEKRDLTWDLEKICREMGVEVKMRDMRRLKAEVGSESDTT